ncbi:glutathione S-transferase [Myriangium duriaei CBS 260.36]|uniref:glutathione transferase n=1 Tax=Myriangium duriaei CBS 260.36 TaxID=1168546 RepID=A0A9P4J8N9_9PEZI|nr:glutathione S-transferase [Myriangium duriaei CBS 260.36]
MSTATEEQPKIVLHWLEKSRSQRIVWLLEECKVPYEIKTYKRVNRLAPPELKKIHPLGKSPVITIQAAGQTEPLVLAESSAISEYLIDHFAKQLVPAQWKEGQQGKVGGETESWLRYRFYMHYCEGSFMSSLLLRYLINALAGPEVPFLIRPVTRLVVGKMNEMFLDPNIKTHFDFLEQQLASSGGDYLCGKEITGADIMMSFPVLGVTSGSFPFDNEKYSQIKAYSERLQQLDLYKTSVQKVEELTGEKYVLL